MIQLFNKRTLILLGALLVVMAFIPFRAQIRAVFAGRDPRTYTIGQRVQQYGPTVHKRIAPYFQQAKVAYPPGKLVLVGLKKEQLLQVYATNANSTMLLIRSYPIIAASGGPGPKLQEGDAQVPEGIYRIESLNPNSSYHLALRVNYPNAFDKEMAVADGRTKLGGDIMIHGSNASVGCLAMGDEASEELFIMVSDTGLDNIEVILAPWDFRTTGMPELIIPGMPVWTKSLYDQVQKRLVLLPMQ